MPPNEADIQLAISAIHTSQIPAVSLLQQRTMLSNQRSGTDVLESLPDTIASPTQRSLHS
jgi:hypothetical protein